MYNRPTTYGLWLIKFYSRTIFEYLLCYRHFLKALKYIVITNILALTIKLEATVFLCIHFFAWFGFVLKGHIRK